MESDFDNLRLLLRCVFHLLFMTAHNPVVSHTMAKKESSSSKRNVHAGGPFLFMLLQHMLLVAGHESPKMTAIDVSADASNVVWGTDWWSWKLKKMIFYFILCCT